MSTVRSLIPLLALVAGCADPDEARCTSRLSPTGNADKDQAALDGVVSAAKRGAVICLRPGTYKLGNEVTLSQSNVELRGLLGGEAILDFTGQRRGANGVSAVGVDNFVIANLKVKNTAGDGVRVTQGTGVTFSRVTVEWDAPEETQNGAYGIYPVQSRFVLVDRCRVKGASDAGIYVGQSSSIVVRNSEAEKNVAGIEIENSTWSEVYGNYSHDNTGGILVFDLPGLTTSGRRSNVHDNRFWNNNTRNFAEPSGAVAIVPTGTGVMIVSSDENELHHNDIRGNDSLGVAVASYALAMRKYDDPKYDAFPEGNYVHDNQLAGNGKAPSGIAAQIGALVGAREIEDLLWDGLVDPKKGPSAGLRNCFQNNGKATFRNLLGLDDKKGFPSTTDLATVDCKQTPLPVVKL